MKKFSKIFILLIGINLIQGKINSQIKNDEKTFDDISKYYQKLIANHILDIVIKFPTNCKNQLFFICTLNFINSFKNITKMVDRFGEKNLNGALYTLLPLLEDYKLKKFNVTVSNSVDEDSAVVTDQMPKSGIYLESGATIRLYTEENSEKELIKVPNIKGKTIEEATQMGADAIVMTRYNTSSIVENSSEVHCYGTAVKFI